MCGIVGFVCKAQNGFFKKQTDTFFQLLFADQLRGDDSTGLIYVEKDAGFGILKEASPAAWAIHSMENHDLLKLKMTWGKALIGHNRKATIGKVTDETAHPFVVDNTFAMVHNGTLYNHRKLADTTVDSEALAKHLQPHLGKTFDLEAFEKSIGEVDGAYAVAAYEQTAHKVSLLRNAQRPLAFVETNDAFVWASEGFMLSWILSRCGYDLSKVKAEILKEHTLLQIDLATNEVTRQEYTPKKAMPPVTKVTHTTTPRTGKGNGVTYNRAAGDVSKNEFKRLRRQLVGTRQVFLSQEYLEENFPKTISQGETAVTLMGAFDDEVFTSIKHNVYAKVDIVELCGKGAEEKDFDNKFMHGKIMDMKYIPREKSVSFFMSDVKVFVGRGIMEEVNRVLETSSNKGKWNATTPANLH
jgi:predicted glutamine amidotransferase